MQCGVCPALTQSSFNSHGGVHELASHESATAGQVHHHGGSVCVHEEALGLLEFQLDAGEAEVLEVLAVPPLIDGRDQPCLEESLPRALPAGQLPEAFLLGGHREVVVLVR